ncbi:MAG: VWA domain-containing protein [Bdellovibrionota bacterium]
MAIFLWLGVSFRLRKLAKFSANRLSELLTVTPSKFNLLLKNAFLLLGTAAIIVALAKPRLGFQWRDVQQGGADIMVVLDLSQSMKASDITPDRLSRAKRELIDLLNMLEGDRIGIIGFGGVPFVQCPLTSDYRLAKAFISQLDTSLMPVQGTAIGDAIRMAVDRLKKTSASDSEAQAILLITDGEDHDSDPLAAAKLAVDSGIKIFSIGIGGLEGAPIPDDNGFKKDHDGNLVISKLDERTLQEISLKTKGTYVRSVTGDMDLENIYKGGIRANVSDAEFGTSRQRVWYERFQWFLALALLCLFSEFFWGDNKKKHRILRTTAIIFLLHFFSSHLAETAMAGGLSPEQAEEAYKNKKFDEAAQGFSDAEIRDPKEAAHPYNRAVSQFQNGDYDKALEGFAKAAQLNKEKFARDSYYNMGNAHVAKGELEKAVQAYQQALSIDPNDKDAEENMSWVMKELEKQKQQQQEKNDQKSEKDDSKKNSDDKGSQEKKDKKDQSKQSQEEKENKKQQDSESQEAKKDEGQSSEHEKDKSQEDVAQSDKNSDSKEKEGGGQADADMQQRDLSKEEAISLLESFEQESLQHLPKPRLVKPSNPSEKDW